MSEEKQKDSAVMIIWKVAVVCGTIYLWFDAMPMVFGTSFFGSLALLVAVWFMVAFMAKALYE